MLEPGPKPYTLNPKPDFEIGAAVALTREHPLWVVAKPASLQMRSNARKTWSCAQVQLEA
jgi:hypothetical protein